MTLSALLATGRARWMQWASMICAMSSLAVPTADAGPIAFQFEGYLDQVDAALAGRFRVGQEYRGRYRFDAAAADRWTYSAFRGSYRYEDFTSTIGDCAGSAPIGRIDVILNDNVQDPGFPPGFFVGSNRYDIYRVESSRYSGPVFGAALGSFLPVEASLQLTDETGTALLDNRLPLVPPDPRAFGYLQQFRLTFLPDGDLTSHAFASVYGQLTVLAPAQGPVSPPARVPEPNTIALLAIAFHAIALFRFGPST